MNLSDGVWEFAGSVENAPARDEAFVAGRAVHVWVFPTPGGVALPAWAALLSRETLAAHTEAPTIARQESALAWLGAELLLARYTGVTPSELKLAARGTGRKPHLDPDAHPDSPLKFNLSHSGGWTLLALASGREVGVDLERARAFREPLRFARRFLHPQEFAHLEGLPEAACGEGLRHLWVRKEAAAKATGYGLPLGLASFSVLDGQAPTLETSVWLELTLKKARAENPCTWALCTLPSLPDPALTAALCVETAAGSLAEPRLFQLG